MKIRIRTIATEQEKIVELKDSSQTIQTNNQCIICWIDYNKINNIVTITIKDNFELIQEGEDFFLKKGDF